MGEVQCNIQLARQGQTPSIHSLNSIHRERVEKRKEARKEAQRKERERERRDRQPT